MNAIATQKIGVGGQYRMEVLRADRSVKFDSGWQDNLVTDAGLDALGTTVIPYQYLQVGAGNAAPAFTDIALASRLAGAVIFPTAIGTTQVSLGSSTTPIYYYDQATVTFGVGAVVGNVAELGLATAASGGTLFSRALVKDSGGSPTTVSVFSDEQLRVTYRINWYINEVDMTTALDLTEWSGTVTTRFGKKASGVDGSNFMGTRGYETGGWIGRDSPRAYASTTLPDFFTSVSGLYTSLDSATFSFVGSYSTGSHQRTCRMALSTAQGNMSGGIGIIGVTFTQFGYRNFLFNPVIPKSDLQKLTLDFTITWDRL